MLRSRIQERIATTEETIHGSRAWSLGAMSAKTDILYVPLYRDEIWFNLYHQLKRDKEREWRRP